MKLIYLLLGVLMISFVIAIIIPIEVNPLQPAYLNQINNFTEMNYFLGGIYIGYMYFNIESAYNDPVIWNISRYSENVYNFRVRGGRKWIISGNELN